ncbi:esterase [Aquimarina sp. TRL1]|uniref:alpha/beta hydrolase n=1 Tax=Aquimarina sp. (strain TRL1) TaxID=2736252 RepID=UPI00158E5DD0|nr:esterase [Aquimarina sp. TRL1]QKX06452.1 esterase [Aquimarina sp. TRL1]
MNKQVNYQASNTYDTLNSLTDHTKNVWLVFHGIGYLSRYFIRLFSSFPPEENYIIAPQAPAKYYKDEQYKRVGSSWLTRENTLIDTQNVLNYIDAIMTSENIPSHVNLNVLGYSQGVSIASRWIASRKINCNALVLISGGFPKELTKENFLFLPETTQKLHILGANDPYFEKSKVIAEKSRVQDILPGIRFITHQGGHELDWKTLQPLL